VHEQAPPVLGVALAAAALVLPASVMGHGAGLELLQPFAVTLLAALVTALVVVLLVVPGLYPALAGLDPLPESPDEVDVERSDADRRGPPGSSGPGSAHGRHERTEPE
jgi:hypothetical protein